MEGKGVRTMKKIKVEQQEIYLYNFEELEHYAREKAIEEHRSFLLSVMNKDDFISGDPEYDTEESLQETYEKEYAYYEENDDPIIESIKINDYLFFYDGSIASCVTYMYGDKIGKTECTYHGKVFIVV